MENIEQYCNRKTHSNYVRKRAEARWEELTKEQQWDLIRMLHKKWEESYEDVDRKN